MQILFFGGSFDPPHIGHLILPRDVMEHFGFEKVIFIPAYISPFKAKRGHRAPAEDRLKMLQLVVEEVPYYGIEPYEILKGGVSYTYETALYLREKYNLQKVHWLMGDDTFWNFDRWFRFGELKELIIPVVVLRNHQPGDIRERAFQMGLKDFLLYPSRRIEISSTEIRERLREGKDVRFMVPEKVYSYIRKRKLYAP